MSGNNLNKHDSVKVQCPSANDLHKAKKIFLNNEPQDLFYRVSIELVNLAIEGNTKFTIAEALSVLLQTWNIAYYRFHRFDAEHYKEIEQLIQSYQKEIMNFRKCTILSLKEEDKLLVTKIFMAFETVLKPVGAAKALHLLAPNFFPLWDEAIAKAYGVKMKKAGENSENYWKFMKIYKEQCKEFKENIDSKENALKAIDEYNYCHFTKHWI